MKSEVCVLIIVLLFCMAVTPALFAAQEKDHPYPDGLPADFQKAPVKDVCESEAPLSVQVTHYVNFEQGWVVGIASRNHRELFILLITPGGNFLAFNTKDGWKWLSKLTDDEAAEKNKEWFNGEEGAFLNSCLQKAEAKAAEGAK